MLRKAVLTAAALAAALPLRAQYAAPWIEELQPPAGQSLMAPDGPDKQLQSLEAAVAAAGARMSQRKLAEARIATPPDYVRQIEKDYALDPANKDLASELQPRVRIYTAKAEGKPLEERRFILAISGPDSRKRLPVPTLDCQGQEGKVLRVIAGRYLAVSSAQGLVYSDLSRSAPSEGSCQSFELVGAVRFGTTAALQGVKSLDVLPDALREAGLSEASAQQAAGAAAKFLWAKPKYEVYGNKDKLVATYPTSEGGELKRFWP